MKKKLSIIAIMLIALLTLVSCTPSIPFYGTDSDEGIKNKGLIITLKENVANVLGESTITIPGDWTLSGLAIEDVLTFSGYQFISPETGDETNWGYINDEGSNSGYFGNVLQLAGEYGASQDSYVYAGHLDSAFPIGEYTFLDVLSMPQEAFTIGETQYSFIDVAESAEVVFNIADFGIEDLNYGSDSSKVNDFTTMNVNFFFFDASNFEEEEFNEDMNSITKDGGIPEDVEDKYRGYLLGNLYLDIPTFNPGTEDGTNQNYYFDFAEVKYAHELNDYSIVQPKTSDSFPYYLDLSHFFDGQNLVGDIGLIPYDTGDNLREGIFLMAIKYTYSVDYLDEDGATFSGDNLSDFKNELSYGINNPTTYTLPDAEKEGVDFLGWFDNISCDGIPVSAADKYGGIYYAKWRDPNHPYSVKYVNRNSSGNISEILQYDTDLDEGYVPSWKGVNNPTKASTSYIDYTFTGWDADFVAVGNEVYDVVYTAIYEESPRKYSVSYVPYVNAIDAFSHINGVGNPKVVEGDTLFSEYETGKVTELPDMEWDGYTFNGWYELFYDGYDMPWYGILPSIPNNYCWDLDLYGGWTINTYNVSYQDIEGETAYASGTYNIETNESLPTVSKTGYNFLGWTGDGVTTPSKSLKLYGRHGDLTFTANFEANISSTKDVTFTRYLSDDCEFVFEPDASTLNEVLIDDAIVSTDNYTVDSSNKKVIFDAAYLDTLAKGKHTVKLSFSKGYGNCSITVEEPTYYEISISDTVEISSTETEDISIDCTKLVDGFKLKVKVVSDNGFKLVSEDNNTSYVTYGLSETIDQNNVIYTFEDVEKIDITVSILDKTNAFLAGDYKDILTFDVELVYPEVWPNRE